MNKIALILFGVITFVVLCKEVPDSLWRHHLVADVNYYKSRTERFWESKSIGSSDFLTYQPGGVLYLLLPSLFQSYLGDYVNSFIAINFILLGILMWVYFKNGGEKSLLIFILMMFFSGPILLFRFELFVGLLVILSMVLFEKNRYLLSSFCLGLAVMVKVYPIIIYPYYLLVLVKNRKYKQGILSLAAFMIGLAVPLIIYFALGGNLEQIILSFTSNSQKPVGIESLPATIATFSSIMTTGKSPAIFIGNGVWGINGGDLNNILGYLGFILVTIFYLLLIIKNKYLLKFNTGIIFFIVLLFLVMSRNLNPQYLFWAFLIFPILILEKVSRKGRISIISLVMLILFLNQVIYPIKFTELLDFFFTGKHIWLIFIQLVKNFSLVVLLVLSFRDIVVKKSIY